MSSSEVIQVLVVDDEPNALELLVTWFEIAGFRVVSARDGATALRCIRRDRPDVVVTDVQMPKMSGEELARRFREEHGGRAPTIIAATGDIRVADQLVDDDNFLAVFRKPIDMSRLIRLVRAAARVRRLMSSHVKDR